MAMANAEDVARAVAALAAASQSGQSVGSQNVAAQNASLPQYSVPGPILSGTSKYNQLLALIEELGKDVRPTYTGNKNCSERLKRGIIHARVLVRECLHEVERSVRQNNSQQ